MSPDLEIWADAPWTEAEYAEAAAALSALGFDADADSLAGMARPSTGPGGDLGLGEADREWRDRYRDHQPTLTEQRDQALLASGRVRLLDTETVTSIDGVGYAPAVLTGPAGATAPAVVASTHADTTEVITGFRTGDERRSWLDDRARSLSGRKPEPAPLAACSEGPECRVTWEERVLARLLSHGDPGGGITAPLSPTEFSAHSRIEIYQALLGADLTGPPDRNTLWDSLSARLARTPSWATDYVGPRGYLTLAYAARLAVTPVTGDQAESAVNKLAGETQHPVDPVEIQGRKMHRLLRSGPVRPQPVSLQNSENPVRGVVPHM